MSSLPTNVLDDVNVDELFFDSGCISIKPTQIANESPIKIGNQFSILNVNIRSLSKNFSLLLSLLNLSKVKYTILVITETWCHDSDDSLFNIPGYENISLNRKDTKKGGGLRIYFHDSIKLIKIDDNLTGIHDSHECLACELDMENKYKLNIIGIYRPPKSNMNSFIKYIKSKKLAQNSSNSNFIKIIAGDMNIPYSNDILSLPRIHQEYFEIFVSNSFKFHITQPTRFGTSKTKDTTIDHIWSNCFFDSFSFTINFKISDHVPSAVIFDHNIPVEPYKVKFFDFSCKNIENFLRSKHGIFNDLIDYSYKCKSASKSTEYIFLEILKIVRKYFPIRTQQISVKRLKTPWLTKHMIKCLRNKHKLFELYKKHKIRYSVYRKFSIILRTIINRSKTIYERNLFKELSGNTRGIWKRINSLMRPNNKIQPPFIIDTDKITHNENNEISDSFIKHFDCLPDKLLSDLPKPKHNYNFTEKISMNENSMALFPTTPNEIIGIINDLKNSNKIGDIPTKFLKLAIDEVSIIFANLFNKIIEEGEYPEFLKKAILTPVYKKGSKTDISNYRPISVLKLIDKIFEKLIYTRLENFFNKFNLFSTNQFGFTRGKDTGSAVTKLVHEVTAHLDINNYSLCIFADLSKAFDTVNHSLLMDKLYRYGIRGITHKLIKSFLSNRQHQVKYKNAISKSYFVRTGVPQGSCLGPLLFNIYTIDVENALKNSNVTMYADDITIEITGNNLQTLGSQANNILDIFNEYCVHNYLSISAIKTVFMIFANTSLSTDSIPTINLGNSQIKKVDTTCYLGIYIDEKLKFTKQAEEIRQKLNMYKSISRKINNKLPLVPAKIYYFSLVQSHLIYGLTVWGGALFVNETHRDLQIKQDKIVRALFAKFFPAKNLDEIYIELRIAKLKQLYKIYVSLYFFDIIYTNKYPQIKAATNDLLFDHSYNTRKNSLIIPLNRFPNFRHNFLYNAVKVWNEIPSTIKHIVNKKKFKNEIKKHFMAN